MMLLVLVPFYGIIVLAIYGYAGWWSVPEVAPSTWTVRMKLDRPRRRKVGQRWHVLTFCAVQLLALSGFYVLHRGMDVEFVEGNGIPTAALVLDVGILFALAGLFVFRSIADSARERFGFRVALPDYLACLFCLLWGVHLIVMSYFLSTPD